MKFYSQVLSKSQKYTIKPKFSITMDFSNNLLQTFIIDLFEKGNIELEKEFLNLEDLPYHSNIIRANFKNIIYFLIIQCKNDFIKNVQNNQILLETLDH